MNCNIYHITAYKNLANIISYGGLNCKNNINYAYKDISLESVQDRRMQTKVPLRPHGCLHDYVPFYFCARSPMLYYINIKREEVPKYNNGQDDNLHLVVKTYSIVNSNIDFVFTDGHAVVAITSFEKNIKKLANHVDWGIINSSIWYDTPFDPDRKRRKQAEFLVYRFAPIGLIDEIGVYNTDMLRKVQKLLLVNGLSTSVRVRQNWYY